MVDASSNYDVIYYSLEFINCHVYFEIYSDEIF